DSRAMIGYDDLPESLELDIPEAPEDIRKRILAIYSGRNVGTISSMKKALEQVRPASVNYQYFHNRSIFVKPGSVRITITEHKPLPSKKFVVLFSIIIATALMFYR